MQPFVVQVVYTQLRNYFRTYIIRKRYGGFGDTTANGPRYPLLLFGSTRTVLWRLLPLPAVVQEPPGASDDAAEGPDPDTPVKEVAQAFQRRVLLSVYKTMGRFSFQPASIGKGRRPVALLGKDYIVEKRG
jgi:hypothetical protein